MVLTPQQIAHIRESWTVIEPTITLVSRLFYFRLFELNPRLRSRFRGGLEDQGAKLMATFKTAVDVADHFDDMLPVLRHLGCRHAEYGIEKRDYATGRIALLWALQQALGEAFTFEIKDAWTAIYDAMAATMSEAALVQAEAAHNDA